jgi:tetratricopeptide (TPR) repeat protein
MNSRRACASFSLLLALVFTACVRAAPTVDPASKPAGGEKRYQNLIDQLADPDPLLRDHAAEELTRIGARARPALLEAINLGDPQVSPRAGEVLLKIPWYEPHDPNVVRQLLQDYGTKETGDRARIAEMLAQFPAHVSATALVRLAEQDPSPTVRWMVMRTISQHMYDDEMAKSLREVDVTHAGAPLLAVAARAWLSVDPEKAMALLHRAVHLEDNKPSFDSGALDFAFDLLVSSAKAKKQLEQAAQLLRLQARRERQLGDDDPTAVYELFALHAQDGPIKGLSDDLRDFQAYLGHPQVLYCLSIMEQRLGHGMTAIALDRAAFAASVTSQQSRWNAAAFLSAHEWLPLAKRELVAVLRGEGDSKLAYDLLARTRLSTLLGEDGDDNAAADQLRAAVEELRDSARSRPFIEDLVAQVHWREFRAARTAGDEATMNQKVEALVALSPSESSIALDLVPYLKERGRADDAKAVFNKAYETANAKLAVDPLNPEQLNEVAWLCARCDERIEDAVKMAMRAVSLAPESYAILDTAAEANFRAGNAKKAVELETRALELKPNDKFMLEQIARFRKGLQH